ncbi:HD domain-containing protein [Pontibacter roseus]|uniref:HD domain-containing protein n=1 Tax=Pontibacter roseus TaxID=336989 RepID=UPI0003634A8A|nr:HD domain-containing protein [Pontibacter roseus]
MRENLMKVLEVLTLAEKIKCEMRHSWLSNGRQESVAEHTWRMSLMAVLLEPYLEHPVDMARLLKMIILHDLVEAEAGDIPAFNIVNEETRLLKQQREQQAIENLRQQLSAPTGQEVYELWHEFEDKQTYEAKVANALDKLEVQIQHNHADMSTWIEIEREFVFLMGRHTAFDKGLEEFRALIEEMSVLKMEQAGICTTTVKERMMAKGQQA